ncbi:MAG: hypothetical protein IT353_15745 [Gemmatimonadaceae bacterium]|nr:hypothetical protein [Gemmatimonadaceae bacterium]
MVVGLMACGDRAAPGPASDAPPTAEFLLAAGDSTYWVQSSAQGIRTRSAPILLTRVDSQFIEVFIAEDGIDYDEAGFAAARVYARTITGTDSVLLFDEGTVMREAADWKRRHPNAEAIDPSDEELPPDPATLVSEDVEILDVHGPWVTFNHLLDVDVEGAPHRHVGKRFVVDVRDGTIATLASLFGAAEAERLAAAGRQSFDALVTTIRTTNDERAALARETLDSFRFDPTSFGISDSAGVTAVAFMVPGSGVDGEALALNLPPVPARNVAWWAEVAGTLPRWSADSTELRWARGAIDVVARPIEDGDVLAVSLVTAGTAPLREWAVVRALAPAYQLLALDTPAASKTIRDALARAFDASAATESAVRAVRRTFVPRITLTSSRRPYVR